MRSTVVLGLGAAALLVAGCGGDGSSDDAAGSAGASGSGGTTSSGGSGGSGEAGSGAAPGGVKPKQGPPENRVGGFEIQLPDYVLEPGQEETPCYLFDLDIDGASRFVAAAMLETTVGLHHGNITTRPKTGEGLRECEEMTGLGGSEAIDVINGGSVLFGSTTQFEGQEWRTFPEGMAFEVDEGFEIVARMHYLNSTPETVTVAPRYEWHTIAEEDVTTPIGPIFWQINGFKIPPRSELTVQTDCYLFEDMYLVDAMPHMHALGTHFQAKYIGGERDGEAFIDQPFFDADTAIRQFNPAIDLSQGDGLSFSCTWNNTFDKEIGEGIGDDEMCMMFGYGYPPEKAATLTAAPEGNCFAILPPGD